MSVEDIYRLPIRTFWSLESNIGRISAEEDMRLLRLLVTQHAPKEVGELARHLANEIGSVVIANEHRDQEGVNRLKGIALQG